MTTYRVFGYMKDRSYKVAMIEIEAISDAISDGYPNLPEYFIGPGVDQWTDHGSVDISGTGEFMLDEVMISY